ncbi:MAG: hypothetical protein IPL71_10635 [Anaerolineales bacterium]|uniref:hypothetical protein n=1 Tax=Candidatus Villigracilis proximus TaxID=3140683 RepID=UPI0031363C03|nr:hypothetical protein [Anaerolineales bacterium]
MKRVKYFGMMVVVMLIFTALSIQNVTATSESVFNSIPDPLPGNLPSQPYQAQQAAGVRRSYSVCWNSRNLSV